MNPDAAQFCARCGRPLEEPPDSGWSLGWVIWPLLILGGFLFFTEFRQFSPMVWIGVFWLGFVFRPRRGSPRRLARSARERIEP